MRSSKKLSADAPDADPDRFQWDWVTFVIALGIVVILAAITFELWAPHDSFPHR